MRHACVAVLALTIVARPTWCQPNELLRGLPVWRLSSAPVASIGGDANAATEFLRVLGAFRARDGSIAVVNGASQEIRLFDARGRLVRTFGRKGSGPGEFTSMAWTGRAGDTVFVFDAGLRRLTSVLLDHDLRSLSSLQLLAEGKRGPVGVVGRTQNGRWLVATYTFPRLDGPQGVHRLPGSVGLIEADGTGDVTWLGEFPNLSLFVHNPTGNIKQASVGLTAFSPSLVAVASGPFLWFGESGADSLLRFDTRDSKHAVLKLGLRRIVPSRALINDARTRELTMARGDQARAFINAKYSVKYLPRQLPFFEALLPGADGEMWIRMYGEAPSRDARYLVVAPDLKAIAWVPIPYGFRILDVGKDYALGVHEDADGVETIRLYSLSRR